MPSVFHNSSFELHDIDNSDFHSNDVSIILNKQQITTAAVTEFQISNDICDTQTSETVNNIIKQTLGAIPKKIFDNQIETAKNGIEEIPNESQVKEPQSSSFLSKSHTPLFHS